MIGIERQRELEEEAAAPFDELQGALCGAVARFLAKMGEDPTEAEIAALGAALRRETAILVARSESKRAQAVSAAYSRLFEENGEADG